jgi:hypothetical protein
MDNNNKDFLSLKHFTQQNCFVPSVKSNIEGISSGCWSRDFTMERIGRFLKGNAICRWRTWNKLAGVIRFAMIQSFSCSCAITKSLSLRSECRPETSSDIWRRCVWAGECSDSAPRRGSELNYVSWRYNILKYFVFRGWSWLTQERVQFQVLFEHCNEPSAPIKGGEFSYQLCGSRLY